MKNDQEEAIELRSAAQPLQYVEMLKSKRWGLKSAYHIKPKGSGIEKTQNSCSFLCSSACEKFRQQAKYVGNQFGPLGSAQQIKHKALIKSFCT